MKITIFSTKTKHHTYFINKLLNQFEIAAIVYENRRLLKDYPTGPFFNDEQDHFEERFFCPSYDGTPRELSPYITKRTIEVHSVNQCGMSGFLNEIAPDICVSFGVGIIKPHIFNIPRWGTINVHRGIIQKYRGLDSDLWAIYNKEFDKIGVTIHCVAEELDAGDILAQEYLQIELKDEIFHLRYKTTIIATRLVISVLSNYESNGGKVIRIPQFPGTYYSLMPIEKKVTALRNFRDYTNSLLNAKP